MAFVKLNLLITDTRLKMESLELEPGESNLLLCKYRQREIPHIIEVLNQQQDYLGTLL
jgi:hypothetical protein